MKHSNAFRFLLILTVFYYFSGLPSFAADYYWKGGSGNWSQISNWYTTDDPGSTNHTTVPDSNDDVYFNENSGFVSGNNTITINSDATCRSLSFANCTVAPKFDLDANLNIYGSLTLQSGMEQTDYYDQNRTISFKSTSTGNTITTNGVTLYAHVIFDGAGADGARGEWTLTDDTKVVPQHLRNELQRGITVNNGSLILNNIEYTGFHLTTNNEASISMTGATVNVECWEYNSSISLTGASTSGSAINLQFKRNDWSGHYRKSHFKTQSATDQYNVVTVTAGGYMPYLIEGGKFKELCFEGASGTLSATHPVEAEVLKMHAPGKYEFAGNVTVTNTLSIVPFGDNTKGGFLELASTNDSPGTRHMINYSGSGENLTVSNALISDVGISTSCTVDNGIEGVNTSGFTFNTLSGTTRTWIGGTGDFWNEPTNWSGGRVPTPADDVVFDGTSGLSASGEVLIDMTAYAKNLTFKGMTEPPLLKFYFPIDLYGSLEFQSGMKVERLSIMTTDKPNSLSKIPFYTPLTAAINFRSDNPETTITMNGVVPLEIPFYFNSLNGTGSWKLMDELKLHTTTNKTEDTNDRYNGIYLQSGHLDLNENNVSAFRFFSGEDGKKYEKMLDSRDRLKYGSEYHFNNNIYKAGRSLKITGSTINIITYAKAANRGGWIHTGGAPLTEEQSRGSEITVDNISYHFFVGKEDDMYDTMECTGSGIAEGTAYGNISGEMEFKKVTLNCSNSQIQKLNTQDLFFASSGHHRLHWVENAPTINVYNLLSKESCGGLVTLSSPENGMRTIAMGSGATVSLSDMSIQSIKITGDEPEYSIESSLDKGNNEGWDFKVSTPRSFYWIGDNGKWSNSQNWSLESGGEPNQDGCKPGVGDNVFFDDKSFSGPGQQVLVDENAYCNDMKWIGAESLKPVFNTATFGVFINGSLELQKGMQIISEGELQGNTNKAFNFISSRDSETIKTNGVIVTIHMTFDGSGKWTLQDELTQENGTYLSLMFKNGHLDFNKQKVTINTFSSDNQDTSRILDIAGADIYLSGESKLNPWVHTGGVALTKQHTANSTITLKSSGATAPLPNAVRFENKTDDVYYNLVSYREDTQFINGTFNKMILNIHSTINSITTDTLQFKPGYTYKFTAEATSTVNKAWYGSGNNCFYTTIEATTSKETPGAKQANILIKSDVANYTRYTYKEKENEDDDDVIESSRNDIFYIDFIYLRDIKVLTAGEAGQAVATPQKGPQSSDSNGFGKLGNNSDNWFLDDFVEKGQFKALGDDITILCEKFPYIIQTAGMAPTYESTFLWFRIENEKDENGNDIIDDDGKKIEKTRTYIGNDDKMAINSAGDAGRYLCIVDYSGDGECELEADITITASDASYLVWNGSAEDLDWHNPQNWDKDRLDGGNDDGSVPSRCISVLIPAGLEFYPDLSETNLETHTEIACDIITFEHGGEVRRTDLLNYYTRANVELDLPANQWHMLSAPIHNFYTGDIYVTDPEPLKDGYLMEQMKFNVPNPETQETRTYNWTGRYNTADIEYKAGEGFALWIDKIGTEYNEHDITHLTFPKYDVFYNYFTDEGVIKHQSNHLERKDNGRFIFENSINAGNVTLTTSPSAATGDDTPILVGNPFMAHLDFDKFADRNSSSIKKQFKMAYGTAAVDGKVNDFVSYAWDSESNSYISTDKKAMGSLMIPPMQSFLVIPTVANQTLVANTEETVLKPGDKLRSQSVIPTMLSITAIKNEESMKALLLYRTYADNSYRAEEDSYKLFSEMMTEPVMVYTRSNDGHALDINAFGNYDENIQVGVRTSTKGNITLRFEGLDSFSNKEIYFNDIYEDKSIKLEEGSEYNFTKTSNELYLDDRFYLSFSSKSPVGLDNVKSNFSFYNAGSDLHIFNPDGEKIQVYIYNLSGNCIYSQEVSTFSEILSTNVKQGAYVVKLISERQVKTKTIIIK